MTEIRSARFRLQRRVVHRAAVIATCALILQACGGGGSDVPPTAEAAPPPPPPPSSGSVTLSWTPPTTRTDGTALGNLAGYRVRYGPSQGNYTTTITVTNPGISIYVVDDLAKGTYYFVVSAFDSAGGESVFSNIASKTIS